MGHKKRKPQRNYSPMSRDEFEVLLRRSKVKGTEVEPDEEYLSVRDAIQLCIQVGGEVRMIIAKNPGGWTSGMDEKISRFFAQSLKEALNRKFHKKDYE